MSTIWDMLTSVRLCFLYNLDSEGEFYLYTMQTTSYSEQNKHYGINHSGEKILFNFEFITSLIILMYFCSRIKVIMESSLFGGINVREFFGLLLPMILHPHKLIIKY